MRPTSDVAEMPIPEIAPPSRNLHWFFLTVSLLLLALVLLSGMLSVHFLSQLRAEELRATRALAERTRALSGLWLSIQSYDHAVQEFLAQAANDDAATRRRLDQLAVEIVSNFKHYPVDRDSEENALLSGMQQVFSERRTLYVTVLAATPAQRRRESERMLAENLGPVQKQILDWSEKLQAWNGARRSNADHALSQAFAHAQDNLSRALAIAFGSGLLLVLASLAYIIRLNRQTRERYFEVARSRQALQQLSARLVDAQETERRTISRELHDEVGQSIGALLVDVGRLTSALPDARPEVKRQLESIKSVAERTFQSVRNIALLLRPSMLDDLGLAAALEWQAREVSRSSDIEVSVDSEQIPEQLPDDYRISIYRVVQEALNNAVRHSGAKNARVAVEKLPESVVVRVTDDGRGFDPQRSRGMGLLGMEERIKRLAGTLSVDSQPGKGTTVTAELPIARGENR
jgi:signal transduction histidine kinase